MNQSNYDEVQKIKSRLKEIKEAEDNERESSDWSNAEKNEQSEDFCQCIGESIDMLDGIDEYTEISEEVEGEDENEIPEEEEDEVE